MRKDEAVSKKKKIQVYLRLVNFLPGIITVKAPNFDSVFMKNIFLLHIFLGGPLWIKSTERVKSRSL